MNISSVMTPEVQKELIECTQNLVRIKSVSGQEEGIVKFIEATMKTLGYDEAIIDAMGNVVGRIGDGETALMFDSHIDTVAVKDAENWNVPPFRPCVPKISPDLREPSARRRGLVLFR